MLDNELQSRITGEIGQLKKNGHDVILVHGGGPEINKMLDLAQIKSEFVDGHRRTTDEVMFYVQLALKGAVNGELVRLLNSNGVPAVGICGKDGGMVTAEKRYHKRKSENGVEKIDIGFVGDVAKIDTTLVDSLLSSGYVPVIAPLAMDAEGFDYNINADIFAGAMAAALNADAYISLTNVDGLYRDINDASTRFSEMTSGELAEAMQLFAKGGMLPKLESCLMAVEGGAESAHIINGTRPGALAAQLSGDYKFGTCIRK